MEAWKSFENYNLFLKNKLSCAFSVNKEPKLFGKKLILGYKYFSVLCKNKLRYKLR